MNEKRAICDTKAQGVDVQIQHGERPAECPAYGSRLQADANSRNSAHFAPVEFSAGKLQTKRRRRLAQRATGNGQRATGNYNLYLTNRDNYLTAVISLIFTFFLITLDNRRIFPSFILLRWGNCP
jgi:hypothetical protein